jgi:hypothetical protein
MIGQTISHYRIVEKLGEGGMGVVYRAEDTRLGRTVALKALAPHLARDPQHRKRFQQEARAAASLTHPSIAAVYELEEVGEDLYIVYEYVPGENLRASVTRGGLEQETLLHIAIELARALAAAHEHGITHRDLKPENAVRTREGATKILDFGLARIQPAALDPSNASTRLTDAGLVVGTPAYMSPEQLEGKEVDFRTDLFSFGVLLYELATGTHPFQGSSPASTIARILTADPTSLRQRNPLTPPELDRIVRKCLRKRPQERYQSTRDLVVDLEQLRRDARELRQPIAPEVGPEEPTLLRRAFQLIGPSPRRWWELNHLFCILGASVPLLVCWKVKGWIPGTWGLTLFFAVLAFVAGLVTLRLYLLCIAAFAPGALPNEVRRVEPWQWRVDLVFMGLLLVMAATIASTHTGWAALLVALAVAGIVVRLVVEPGIVRAAFPQAYEVVDKGPQASGGPAAPKFYLVAAIQTFYLLPILLAVIALGQTGEDVLAFLRDRALSEQITYAVVIGLVLAGYVISGITAVAMWRGDAEGVQAFCRWFLMYLLIDMFGVVVLIALLLKYANLVAGALLLPVFVYLPFYQRRLARKFLSG